MRTIELTDEACKSVHVQDIWSAEADFKQAIELLKEGYAVCIVSPSVDMENTGRKILSCLCKEDIEFVYRKGKGDIYALIK